jgi:hypothetical protein
MATDPADPSLNPAPPAARPVAPLRGTRSQSMQRLQIGVFGLAAMILLVSLANIIITNARQNEARVVPEAAPTVAAEQKRAAVKDPLADAGVVPDMPDEGAAPLPRSDAAPAIQP